MHLIRSGHTVRTSDLCMNDEVKVISSGLETIAKELSAVFGVPVEWHFTVDNCCSVFGDFGFFIIKLPDHYMPPYMKITDTGYEDVTEEIKKQP